MGRIPPTVQVWHFEVKRSLLGPLPYLLGAGQMLVMGIVFSTMVYQSEESYFRDFFLIQGTLGMFLAPLLTMDVAEERRRGGLDLLRMTGAPLFSLILGRYLAATTLALAATLPTAIFPALLGLFMPIDGPVILLGYLGLFLLLAGYVAVGLFCALLTSQGLSAAFLSFAVLFAGAFLQFAAASLPAGWAQAVEYFSHVNHFEPFALGLLEWRSVGFLLTMGILGVGWSWLVFMERRVARLIAGSGLALALIAVNAGLSGVRQRVDFTASQRLSLGPLTVRTLAELEEQGKKATLSVFLPEEMDAAQLEETRLFLRQLDESCDALSVRFLNLDQDSATAQRLGVDRRGQCALEMGNRAMRLGAIDDTYITGALNRMLQERQVTVCFTQGHGEPRALAPSPEGRRTMQLVTRDLLAGGYMVREIVLYREPDALNGCDVLVVAGPNVNFLPQEREAVTAFLEAGGDGLFLIDPPPSPSLGDVLSPYGVKLAEHLVIEQEDFLQNDNTALLVRRYHPHPITATLGRVTFSVARGIDHPRRQIPGFRHFLLLETSEQSFGETRPARVAYTPDEDPTGPISLGIAAIRERENGDDTRLVVLGDSEFARDNLAGALSNAQLFGNAIAWLADADANDGLQSSIRAARILLPPAQAGRLIAVSLLVCPLLPLLAGLPAFWWRRQHR